MVVITNPDQVAPDWLTAVLTRAGALTEGAVEHVDITTDVRPLSSNARSARCSPASSLIEQSEGRAGQCSSS